VNEQNSLNVNYLRIPEKIAGHMRPAHCVFETLLYTLIHELRHERPENFTE